MKKAFEILAFTLLELVIYVLLISGFYYLFCMLIQGSMGNSIVFDMPYFLACIVRFIPPCAIFSVMLLIFSFISRNCSFKEMIIPYAIVSVLVWFVLVPLSLYYDGQLIPGFTFWLKRLPENAPDAAMFQLPGWTSFLLERFELLHDQLVYFFQGYNKMLGLMQYASFFLSLAALGCFARFSSWRLWNAFFVIFAFAASVVINSYMFDNAWMLMLLEKFNISEGWVDYVPILVNAVIFLLYTLFGVFALIGEARRRRG